MRNTAVWRSWSWTGVELSCLVGDFGIRIVLFVFFRFLVTKWRVFRIFLSDKLESYCCSRTVIGIKCKDGIVLVSVSMSFLSSFCCFLVFGILFDVGFWLLRGLGSREAYSVQDDVAGFQQKNSFCASPFWHGNFLCLLIIFIRVQCFFSLCQYLLVENFSIFKFGHAIFCLDYNPTDNIITLQLCHWHIVNFVLPFSPITRTVGLATKRAVSSAQGFSFFLKAETTVHFIE